jgi:hypothetical protein
MTVYSYNANQLKNKTGPKKPFFTGNKIAILVSSTLILSFGLLVANSSPAPVAVKPAEQSVKVTTPPVDDFQKKWEADQARLGAEQAERERKWEEGKAQREKEAAEREYEAIAALPLAERQSVCTNRSHPYYSAYRDACAKFYSQF